eukprot:SAG11_NODE_23352_length_390_cov_0.883162_1_plen_23_part_01
MSGYDFAKINNDNPYLLVVTVV